MANYYATARTNYVRFKDQEALDTALELAEKFNIAYYHDAPNEPLCVMFYSGDEDGGFNLYDSETDENADWDQIAVLMDDDQVLIVLEAGAEKLRYISGYAQAWNSKGDHVTLSLVDIYALARNKFGINPTVAEYAELPPPRAI